MACLSPMCEAFATSEATRALRRAVWLCCTAACGLWLLSGYVEASFIHARLVEPDPSLLVIDGAPGVAGTDWESRASGALPSVPADHNQQPSDPPEDPGVTETTGMAAGANSTDSGPSSAPAAACLGTPELPMPTLTAWLHHGQYLAVPPAPRSGQCRPP